MSDHAQRLARIAQAWDETANGYAAYFVPRFAPWVTAAVQAITTDPLPDGPVLVPCCGTFPELETLIERLPEREIVGIDLSAGMVRLARERAAGRSNVSVVEGDASTLDGQWTGRCAAVVSVFGLQQLPDPAATLRSWSAALAPGGRLSVVYWPSVSEAEGPFALLTEVFRAHGQSGDNAWEDDLATATKSLSFPISHPDAATFFDAFHHCGPMRALALAKGEAFVGRLRAEFLRRAPSGEWIHHPRAHHILTP